MLGVSIYLQQIDRSYLEKAAQSGVKVIFTSLQIPEEEDEPVLQRFENLLVTCKKLQLEVIADISDQTLVKLGLGEQEKIKLKELGLTSLRLDDGFEDMTIIKQTMNDFNIVLNASTLHEEDLQQAKQAGIDLSQITVMHNFYPHPHTGLGEKQFKEKNELFKRYNLKVSAFVPGDEEKRQPLYEGLPTLEAHRWIHPTCAAIELLRSGLVDDIFIGDTKATSETLNEIAQYMKDKTILFPVVFEKEFSQLINESYTCRKDSSDELIRLVAPRVPQISATKTGKRFKGSITMDNHLFKRYSGEIHIVRKDLDGDPRVNVIGFVHPKYVSLLDGYQQGEKVRFVQ